MAERELTRRQALKMGVAAAGGLALVEGVGLLQHTRLNFVKEEDQFRRSEKGVIVFGGYTIDDAGPVGSAIAPSFKVPTLYTVYARNRVDMVGAVNSFLQIKKDTGMRKLTIYGHSEGVQIAGAFTQLLYERVGDEVEVER